MKLINITKEIHKLYYCECDLIQNVHKIQIQMNRITKVQPSSVSKGNAKPNVGCSVFLSTNKINKMSINPFAIKIKERFFYEYRNDRVKTAWSLAGAQIFLEETAKFEKIQKMLNSKKIKYEKAYIGIIQTVINVDEPQKIKKEEVISKAIQNLCRSIRKLRFTILIFSIRWLS